MLARLLVHWALRGTVGGAHSGSAPIRTDRLVAFPQV